MSALQPLEEPPSRTEVRASDAEDRVWAESLWQERWGGHEMIVHDEAIALRELEALIVWRGSLRVGLGTYRIRGPVCEIVSLDSLHSQQGIGTSLLQAVAERARASHCTCLRVTTTNDNLTALGFYQRRGFGLRELRPGAVGRARWKKPQIPRLSPNGIALRDEIELEKPLETP